MGALGAEPTRESAAEEDQATSQECETEATEGLGPGGRWDGVGAGGAGEAGSLLRTEVTTLYTAIMETEEWQMSICLQYDRITDARYANVAGPKDLLSVGVAVVPEMCVERHRSIRLQV